MLYGILYRLSFIVEFHLLSIIVIIITLNVAYLVSAKAQTTTKKIAKHDNTDNGFDNNNTFDRKNDQRQIGVVVCWLACSWMVATVELAKKPKWENKISIWLPTNCWLHEHWPFGYKINTKQKFQSLAILICLWITFLDDSELYWTIVFLNWNPVKVLLCFFEFLHHTCIFKFDFLASGV